MLKWLHLNKTLHFVFVCFLCITHRITESVGIRKRALKLAGRSAVAWANVLVAVCMINNYRLKVIDQSAVPSPSNVARLAGTTGAGTLHLSSPCHFATFSGHNCWCHA